MNFGLDVTCQRTDIRQPTYLAYFLLQTRGQSLVGTRLETRYQSSTRSSQEGQSLDFSVIMVLSWNVP